MSVLPVVSNEALSGILARTGEANFPYGLVLRPPLKMDVLRNGHASSRCGHKAAARSRSIQSRLLPLSLQSEPPKDQEKASFNVACTHAPMAWGLRQLTETSVEVYFTAENVLVMQDWLLHCGTVMKREYCLEGFWERHVSTYELWATAVFKGLPHSRHDNTRIYQDRELAEHFRCCAPSADHDTDDKAPFPPRLPSRNLIGRWRSGLVTQEDFSASVYY